MKRAGFTLIELLVVIAIIAILAAITFPVVARTKDSAYRNSDIQNMNTLRSALQVYRVDQGGYPPQLLGYVTLYTSGPNVGQVVPADQLKSYLYPKRVTGIEQFRPAYNRVDPAAVTTAVWPNQDPRAAGAAEFDANGDGTITPADDNACARQQFGPTQVVQRGAGNAEFYRISGYDVSTVKTPTGDRTELRYALFWSGWGLGAGGCTLGSAFDDPRQLGYNDPPENTIVTWNSFFRQYNSDGTTQRVKLDIALTLGGGAKLVDSANLSDRSWRFRP